MTSEEFALLKQLAENTAKIVEDHESRIRVLERWLYMGLGVVGIASFVLHGVERIIK